MYFTLMHTVGYNGSYLCNGDVIKASTLNTTHVVTKNWGKTHGTIHLTRVHQK